MTRKQVKRLMKLRAELAQAWKAACKADGIPPTSKFVEFSKTPESIAYNKAALKYFNDPTLKFFTGVR